MISLSVDFALTFLSDLRGLCLPCLHWSIFYYATTRAPELGKKERRHTLIHPCVHKDDNDKPIDCQHETG